VNQMVPEIVRIGVAKARIKCVTPQRVEYLDEAGLECFVDLEECSRNCIQSDDESEGDFALFTSEDREGAAAWSSRRIRYVGLRGMLDDPPWIEFTNKRRTRFEFGSSNEAVGLKLQLMQARWRTLDDN
jgi:hypothetical protein